MAAKKKAASKNRAAKPQEREFDLGRAREAFERLREAWSKEFGAELVVFNPRKKDAYGEVRLMPPVIVIQPIPKE